MTRRFSGHNFLLHRRDVRGAAHAHGATPVHRSAWQVATQMRTRRVRISVEHCRDGSGMWAWSLVIASIGLSAACGNASTSQDSNAVAGASVETGGASAAGASAGGADAVGGGTAGGWAGAGHDTTGGAGMGSAGASNGGASTGGAVQCSSNGLAGDTTDPQLQRTVQGVNGTFVDSCDAQGNLMDYYCETMQTCTFGTPQPDPIPMCTSMNTGKVSSKSYDCSGHCVNGTCSDRCPAFGDLLTYLTVDKATGAATFENQTDHRRYACQLTFDASGDSYNCTTDPTVGLVVKMIAQGLKSLTCTGGDFGSFGIGPMSALSTDPQTCDYECTIPPA
jgi:hypothetical protein